MTRRDLIALLGSTAATWPLAARAQQAGKVPTIGFLGQSTRSAGSEWVAAFVQRLRELGWSEGRTIAIEYRWGEGREERFAELAGEFVRLKVDVIVTGGNAAVAAKQVSSVVPIVFALVDDPVSMGLIASLARPGGNITGLSIQATDLAGKRLELLREVVPGLHRLAIMANVDLRPPRWRWVGLRRRPARSASKSSPPTFGERRTSHLPSRVSKVARTHSMLLVTRS